MRRGRIGGRKEKERMREKRGEGERCWGEGRKGRIGWRRVSGRIREKR